MKGATSPSRIHVEAEQRSDPSRHSAEDGNPRRGSHLIQAAQDLVPPGPVRLLCIPSRLLPRRRLRLPRHSLLRLLRSEWSSALLRLDEQEYTEDK